MAVVSDVWNEHEPDWALDPFVLADEGMGHNLGNSPRVWKSLDEKSEIEMGWVKVQFLAEEEKVMCVYFLTKESAMARAPTNGIREISTTQVAQQVVERRKAFCTKQYLSPRVSFGLIELPPRVASATRLEIAVLQNHLDQLIVHRPKHVYCPV